MRTKIILLGILSFTLTTLAADEMNSASAVLSGYVPAPAPQPSRLALRSGDRLAICGDSITEQKMYSRIMEDYLTMCVPDLKITVRQYGWSGEKVPGFLSRMTNDCLRFKPTIATTCYGMNDHEYRGYVDSIGETYRTNSDAMIQAFKAQKVRVILGSAGSVGKVPAWHKDPGFAVDDLNRNLGTLRNIDIALAKSNKVGFADVFWPMLNAGAVAHQKYDTNYNISGGDGVHPGWAGHTVMAYAFLKAMGLDGDLGTFTVDLKNNRMKTSKGHEVVSAKNGEFEIKSSRYPFCPCEPETSATKHYPACGKDDISKDDSIRSGMTLIPFNQDLNRLTLIAKRGSAQQYRVTWGSESKTFSAEQLEHGINLTVEFPSNPFGEAFAKVDAAVATKQAFETKEMKQDFRPNVPHPTLEQIIAQTEKVVGDDEKTHDGLAAAIRDAFVPVTHVLKISPE
jgi:lysophospholipase L1-like esterase